MRFDFFRRSQTGSETPDAGPHEQVSATDAAHAAEVQPADASGWVTYGLQLDGQKRVKGYRMAWHAVSEGQDASSQFKLLLSTVSRQFNSPKSGWRMGRLVLFFDVTVDALFLSQLQDLPPENVVLCMGMDALMDADTRSMLMFLRERGFGFMLRDAEGLPEDPELRDIITHIDVGDGAKELVSSIRRDEPPGRTPIQLIASRMGSWSDFDACAVRHVDVFVAGSNAPPPIKEGANTLQPESMLIVRLMQMIQRNEDVRTIESALKRDAAVTYRLLRHINSPAIGAGVEITSLRHAVAMLGYSPLFRWLSLLLATSNRASSPYMMKRAIMRGRFVELMGQGMLPASESDNLFVVGMFSLIDQLLGVTMEEVLSKVQLAESVQQAILSRKGVFGPFLSLAEACETDASQAGRLAEALFLGSDQVNAAHLSAMVWSQDVTAAEATY